MKWFVTIQRLPLRMEPFNFTASPSQGMDKAPMFLCLFRTLDHLKRVHPKPKQILIWTCKVQSQVQKSATQTTYQELVKFLWSFQFYLTIKVPSCSSEKTEETGGMWKFLTNRSKLVILDGGRPRYYRLALQKRCPIKLHLGTRLSTISLG